MAVDSGGKSGASYVEARARNLAWAIDTCLVPGLEGVDVTIAPAYGPSWKSDLAVGGHPGPASCATMAPAIAGWPILCLPIGLVKDCRRPRHHRPSHSEWTLIEAARRIEALVAATSPLPAPSGSSPFAGDVEDLVTKGKNFLGSALRPRPLSHGGRHGKLVTP